MLRFFIFLHLLLYIIPLHLKNCTQKRKSTSTIYFRQFDTFHLCFHYYLIESIKLFWGSGKNIPPKAFTFYQYISYMLCIIGYLSPVYVY